MAAGAGGATGDAGLRTGVLGRTGIAVTELGFGTLILGRLQARVPTDEGAAALRRAYELGVRFIDTAQAYDSYRHVRRFLDDVRPSGLTVTSKSHARTAAEMRAAVEEALRELGVGRLDVMLLHGVRDAEDLRGRGGALEALLHCREQGLVRAIGMSSHSARAFGAALDVPELEVLHPILNRKGLGLIDGTVDELLAHLRGLRGQGRGIYAMKAFGGGHLIGAMEEALAYVRGLGLADAVAVGMKTPAEVETDVRLFATGRLAPEDRASAARFRKRLLVYDSCRACGRCVEACQQGAMRLGEKKAENDADRCVLCGYCAESCPGFCIRVI